MFGIPHLQPTVGPNVAGLGVGYPILTRNYTELDSSVGQHISLPSITVGGAGSLKLKKVFGANTVDRKSVV